MYSKIYIRNFFFDLLLFACLSPAAFCKNIIFTTDSIVMVKFTTDFSITGNGSAANWQVADWNPIIQRSSKTLQNENWNIPAERFVLEATSYDTRFKILYSEKGIYCLYKCEDSLITATLKEDFSSLYNEDVIEAFFRPDTAMPVYFEYELSPLNFELPLLILNNKGKFMGWKPFQYEGARRTIHATTIDKKNVRENRITWTAEFFIPFALLESMGNTPPKKGTQWRANFYRIDYDHHPVYSSWQLTRRSFHDPEKFGILKFE
jgi:hypothetical protein